MHALTLHPDCEPGPIRSVTAQIQATNAGCRALFRLQGNIESIRIPEPQEPERTDYLWKTTCLEVFWQGDGGPSYREFNLSPSTRWAAYDFDDFRENGRDAPADEVAIECRFDRAELVLEAHIISELPVPAQVALNAIVEDREGKIQFWALAFPDGKPEFHSKLCRQIRVEAR